MLKQFHDHLLRFAAFGIATTCLLTIHIVAQAQSEPGADTTVYRCPGSPPIYTDKISAKDAKRIGRLHFDAPAIIGDQAVAEIDPPSTRFRGLSGVELSKRLASQAKDQLKDPDSPKVRGGVLKRTARAGVSAPCGEMNARNSYGGYIGYERFISATNEIVVFERSSASFQAQWAA